MRYLTPPPTPLPSPPYPHPTRQTGYVHDFAITKRYSVVFDGNLVVNWDRAAAGGDMWEFRRDVPGRIGIFPRHAQDESEVEWFDVEPFCVSHVVNAWEEEVMVAEGEEPVVEVVIVANNIGYESFNPQFPAETPRDPDANLHKWRLRLARKTNRKETAAAAAAQESVLRRVRSDFPQYNHTRTGRPLRYVYAQLLDYEEPNHAPYLFGAYKYDLRTDTFKDHVWGEEKGRYLGGEAFFVPRVPPSTDTGVPGRRGKEEAADEEGAEDDGFLLVLVNDVRKKRTELRVYDARTFGDGAGNGPPVATVVCPRRIVPLGTHGVWLSQEEVNRVEQQA